MDETETLGTTSILKVVITDLLICNTGCSQKNALACDIRFYFNPKYMAIESDPMAVFSLMSYIHIKKQALVRWRKYFPFIYGYYPVYLGLHAFRHILNTFCHIKILTVLLKGGYDKAKCSVA